MSQRQQVMVLYLATSALDTRVIARSLYDGTGQTNHMAGDSDIPPCNTDVDALSDGWPLIQLTTPEPWFEADAGRLENLNRIRFWRYQPGEPDYDADYRVSRVENEQA